MTAREFRRAMVLAAMANPALVESKKEDMALDVVWVALDTAEYLLDDDNLRDKLGIDPDSDD